MRRSIHGAGQSRSHDDRGPRESFLASRCGSGTSGRASPSLRHQHRNDFLILIVGDSHLDCRATPAALSGQHSKAPGFAGGYLLRPMSAPTDEDRWGTFQVRQRVGPREHLRRGNAFLTLIVAGHNSVGSTSVAFFRPPPGRRTRPEIASPAARSSSSRPRRIVLLARPVMRDTAETPPRPAMRASAAANLRRPRSSRTGSSAEWRYAMAASSITPRVHDIFGPRRNCQNGKNAIRLFINGPLRHGDGSLRTESRKASGLGPCRFTATTWTGVAESAVNIINGKANGA